MEVFEKEIGYYNPENIFWAIFTFMWIVYVWETYLSHRQVSGNVLPQVEMFQIVVPHIDIFAVMNLWHMQFWND